MIFHLLLNEWKRVMKRPTLFLFVFLFPVAGVLITAGFIYTVANEELGEVELLVIDEDDTLETRALISQLENDETLTGQVRFIKTEEELSSVMDTSSSYAAIVRIPSGFTDQLRSGVNEEIDVFLNESTPFSSQLAQTLLSSGENYISAAQAGVNTVNRYYIQEMDSSERSQAIQQMTIFFTMFALDRNQFFNVEQQFTYMSWKQQLFISIGSLVLFLTYIFFAFIYRLKHENIMNQRFTLLGVTRDKQFIYRTLFHITFLLIFVSSILFLIPSSFLPFVAFDWKVLMQWVMLAIMIGTLYLVSHSLLENIGLSYVFFLASSVILLLFSGAIVPPVYFPDSIGPVDLSGLQMFYHSFHSVFKAEEAPWLLWISTIAISSLLLLTTFLFEKRKGLIQ
ncbi:ABC transporter permease [Halalkalibacillus sediminis]|nr:ABC transporter permease [Halalkalibacillus sediminis]